MRLQDGTSKVSEAAGARSRFHGRIIVDYPRIVFLLAEAIQGLSAEILNLKYWSSTLIASSHPATDLMTSKLVKSPPRHITTMEQQKARSQQRNGLGIALVGRLAHIL